MEEFTGSVISMSSQRNKEESKENEDPNNTAPEDPPGFLERITSFFSFGSNKNEEDKNEDCKGCIFLKKTKSNTKIGVWF